MVSAMEVFAKCIAFHANRLKDFQTETKATSDTITAAKALLNTPNRAAMLVRVVPEADSICFTYETSQKGIVRIDCNARTCTCLDFMKMHMCVHLVAACIQSNIQLRGLAIKSFVPRHRRGPHKATETNRAAARAENRYLDNVVEAVEAPQAVADQPPVEAVEAPQPAPAPVRRRRGANAVADQPPVVEAPQPAPAPVRRRRGANAVAAVVAETADDQPPPSKKVRINGRLMTVPVTDIPVDMPVTVTKRIGRPPRASTHASSALNF